MTSLVAQGLSVVQHEVPAGLIAGDFQFIVSLAGAPDVVVKVSPADFAAALANGSSVRLLDNPAPGTYNVQCSRIAVTGEQISPTVMFSFTVAEKADFPMSFTVAAV